MDHPPSPRIYTEREAAIVLGVKPATLRRWRHEGRGPQYVRVETAIRYRKRDLDAYLSSRTVATEGTDTTRSEATA